MRALDVHGFGGGFTLGTVQAGFELVGKMSRTQGFGVYNTLANRDLLGGEWDSVAGTPENWETVDNVDFVFGNPPCSGFSTLSPKAFRGTDSSINDFMWELVYHAGRIAPPIVAWESVQQTFKQGLELMRALHKKLEEVSGHSYHLTHVLHNNLSHGGTSNRKRYFWVASRVPFGVESNRVTRQGEFADTDHVPTFAGMLRDLKPLGLTMTDQRYPTARIVGEGTEDEHTVVMGSSLWSQREAHDGSGIVDGHNIYQSNTLNRTMELLRDPNTSWAQGENMSAVLRRYYHANKALTPSWNYMTKKTDEASGEIIHLPKWERLVETDFAMGFNQPTRWRDDRPANVITGGAVHLVVHPSEDRLITHREAARIQGFPDDWKIFPVRKAPDVGPGWGKGVPVQAGRWIARWALEALGGTPGTNQGVPLQTYDKKLYAKFGEYENETIINTTNDYKVLEKS